MSRMTCDRCCTRIVAHEHQDTLVWCSIQVHPANICAAGPGGHRPDTDTAPGAPAYDFALALAGLKAGDSYRDVANVTGIPRDTLRRSFPAYACHIEENTP